MPRVRVQAEDFDTGRELDALTAGRADVGALASFVGLVRDANDGSPVKAMTSSRVTMPSALAIFAPRAITPMVKAI